MMLFIRQPWLYLHDRVKSYGYNLRIEKKREILEEKCRR